MTTVPILTFHDLADDSDAIAFPPSLFAALLDAIACAGWQVIALESWIADRASAARTPQVILTFDDGYRSFYEAAYPLLAARGLPATVFINPSEQDTLPAMYGRARMRWEELREIHAGGIAIGAHSLSHPDLTTLPDARLREEIAGSQSLLEDRLGASVRTFAYPFGRYDAHAIAAARACFDCAVTTDLRLASGRDDLFTLPRIEMAYFRHPALIQMLTGRLLPAYLAIRRGPRAIRQRLIQDR